MFPMGHAVKDLRTLSAGEYLAWEETQRERHELVEGVPHAMAGASRVHNLLVGNLYALLRPLARARGCRLYSETVKLRLGESTFYYPDLMLVCAGDPPHAYYEDQPCLLIEVVSQATEVIDRREKLSRYLGIPSLQGYLLVDSRTRKVEGFLRRGEGWIYALWEGVQGKTIEVPCLGIHISMGQIYEDTGIPEDTGGQLKTDRI